MIDKERDKEKSTTWSVAQKDIADEEEKKNKHSEFDEKREREE